MQYALRNQTEKLRKKKEGIIKELNPYSVKYTEVKNKLDELNNEFSLHAKKKKNAEGDVQEIEDKVQEINLSLEELKVYSAQIDEALQKISEIGKEHRAKIKELRQQEEDLVNEVHDVNQKLEEIKQSSGQVRQQNQIITELMKAQKKKELHGICGRLGDLGAIDEIYDIAISTACSQLENIVVNRYDEAQKCVEFLRANRIGRCTFIALDKIGWVREHMERPFRAPAHSERLFDLIQFKDNNLRIAFYYALRDTLVCRDIDTATGIAYGAVRHRVVTLKGELIDTSGTMSGGGKPKKGAMGSRLNQETGEDLISQMSQKSDEYNRRIDEVRKERQDNEKKLQEVAFDEGQAKKERQKITMDIEFNTQQLKETNARLQEINKLIKNKGNDDKTHRDLEKKIQEHERMLNDVNDTVQEYNKKIEEIDEQINDMGGKALKDQQAKVTRLTQDFDDLEKEVSKMQAQVQNVVKTLNKNKKEQLEFKEKLEKVKKSLEKLKEEEANLEEEGMRVLALMKGCEEKKRELEKKFQEFDKENEKIKKIMTELRTSIEAISAEKEEKNKILK